MKRRVLRRYLSHTGNDVLSKVITPFNPFQRAVSLLIMPFIGGRLCVYLLIKYIQVHAYLCPIIVKDILLYVFAILVHSARDTQITYLSHRPSRFKKKKQSQRPAEKIINPTLSENPQSYSVQQTALQCGRTHLRSTLHMSILTLHFTW